MKSSIGTEHACVSHRLHHSIVVAVAILFQVSCYCCCHCLLFLFVMVIAHVALRLLMVKVVSCWAFGRCVVVSKFRVKDLARSMIHVPSHCSFVVGGWVIVQVACRGQLYGDCVCPCWCAALVSGLRTAFSRREEPPTTEIEATPPEPVSSTAFSRREESPTT